MPPVHWIRDAAWRVYSICVSIKEVADRALRMGNYDLAFAKYEDAQTVHKTACHNNNRIAGVEDEGFHTACDHLVVICETNIFLVTLKWSSEPNVNLTALEAADFVLKGSKPSELEDPDRYTPISQSNKSRLYHYRGIALSMKGNDKLAFGNLRKAYQLDPSDKDIKRDFLIAGRRLKAKTPEKMAAAGIIEASRLRNEPLKLEPPVFTQSEFINTERYLLRKAGYQGDMLEHIEGNKPVDMQGAAQAERSAAQLKAQMKSKKAGSSITWVGGGYAPENARTHGVGLMINQATNSMEVMRF